MFNPEIWTNIGPTPILSIEPPRLPSHQLINTFKRQLYINGHCLSFHNCYHRVFSCPARWRPSEGHGHRRTVCDWICLLFDTQNKFITMSANLQFFCNSCREDEQPMIPRGEVSLTCSPFVSSPFFFFFFKFASFSFVVTWPSLSALQTITDRSLMIKARNVLLWVWLCSSNGLILQNL